MIDNKMRNFTLGMGIMERYQWLLALDSDMKAFIEKWEYLFNSMAELRTDEINELAEEDLPQMSEDEIFEANINFEYSEEIIAELNKDEKCQKLQREYCELIGIKYKEPRQTPIEINECLEVNQKIIEQKKRPLVKKVEKNFHKINGKIQERNREIREKVIRKYIPNYETPHIEDRSDFSKLMSTEDLLKNAIKDFKEYWELRKGLSEKPPLELPDIDLDELRKKLGFLP